MREPEPTQPLWKKPWIIVSAAGAVVVLLAALLIPAMVSGNRSRTPAVDATPTVPSPAAPPTPAPTEAGSPAAEKPRDQKPAKAGKQSRRETKAAAAADPASAPKAAPGICDLTEGEIPRSLSRAESLMHAGNLEGAQDAYQRLVGCPSAHEKAAEGLRLVKLRIAAQSSSVQ